MSTLIWVYSIITVWTILSVIYFIRHLGDKYTNKSKYEKYLYPISLFLAWPNFLIAFVVGRFTMKGQLKGNRDMFIISFLLIFVFEIVGYIINLIIQFFIR